jgi:hypothetical protein
MISPAGRASPHSRQVSPERDCTRCTQRYASRCPKMPARCGRASSEPGTSDRQDVRSPRAERWTTAVEIGASCFLRTGVSATLSITACPEGRAARRLRLSARCSILLNLRKLLSLFPAICFPRKRTARLSPAVQVREETPLGGQQQRGAIANLVLQIKKPHALTGLNLCSRFFCSPCVHAVDASYRVPITLGGVLTTPGLTRDLVLEGMFPRS